MVYVKYGSVMLVDNAMGTVSVDGGCYSMSAVGGASNGESEYSWDHVSSKVTNYINPPGNERTGAGVPCPNDLNPGLWEGST